jgi:hypothetical protein
MFRKLVETVAALSGQHVRVEGRRLSVSDAAFCKTVRGLAGVLAPQLALELEPDDAGYRVRLMAGAEPVSAVVVLERIRFERGVLRVEVATPEGVSLASRPVVGAFAAVVGRLFGGTWAGGKLLSLSLPETLRWDGKRATLDVAIDQAPLVGQRLAALEANATARREGGMLVLELDRDGVAQAIVGALMAAAFDRVGLRG